MPKRVSTVLGREFADSIRAVIERTGSTPTEVGRRVGWDQSKMSDFVNGKGGVSLEEFTFLLGMCQASPDEFEYLKSLFLESREKGWLQLYDSVVPPQLRTLIHHERIAKTIVVWSSLLVPGLLQIEAYARAAAEISPSVKNDDVAELVKARMQRRDILEGSREFVFYVYEPVLYSVVGSRDVLQEQLHELLRMLVRPYIAIRIVPAGWALTGDFRVMTFEKYEPVVYVESLNSALFLDDKASVTLHQEMLTMLDRVALSAEQSREIITRIVT